MSINIPLPILGIVKSQRNHPPPASGVGDKGIVVALRKVPGW